MKKNTLSTFLLLVITSIFIGFGPSTAPAETYNDTDALAGAASGKALFDINVSSAQKIALYLSVIKQTHQDLIRQKFQPDFVVAFRGASVRLISTEIWSFEEKDQESLKLAAGLIQELSKLGVQFEGCNIATSLFKVDNDTIIPEVKIVGNTFVSLIGYQNKGFAIIPIQ